MFLGPIPCFVMMLSALGQPAAETPAPRQFRIEIQLREIDANKEADTICSPTLLTLEGQECCFQSGGCVTIGDTDVPIGIEATLRASSAGNGRIRLKCLITSSKLEANTGDSAEVSTRQFRFDREVKPGVAQTARFPAEQNGRTLEMSVRIREHVPAATDPVRP
jgi:hypothetical protein